MNVSAFEMQSELHLRLVDFAIDLIEYAYECIHAHMNMNMHSLAKNMILLKKLSFKIIGCVAE